MFLRSEYKHKMHSYFLTFVMSTYHFVHTCRAESRLQKTEHCAKKKHKSTVNFPYRKINAWFFKKANKRLFTPNQ